MNINNNFITIKSKIFAFLEDTPFFLLSLVILSINFLFYNRNLPSFLFFIFVILRIITTKDKKIGISAIICALICFGVFCLENSNIQREQKITGTKQETLTIELDTIKIKERRLSFCAKNSDNKRIMCFAKLANPSQTKVWQEIKTPLVCKACGNLEKPSLARNLDGFDYQKYLRGKKIALIYQIEQYSLQKHKIASVKEGLSYLRFLAIRRIKQTFPNPLRNFLGGLLLSYFDEEFSQDLAKFKRLGIIHFFCLSGLHVMFFLTLFRFPLLRSRVSLETTLIWQLFASFFYAGIAGFAVSLLRGLFQKNAEFIAKQWRLGLNKQDCFFFSLFLGILINPYLLQTASGQLSYAFGLAIIFWQPLTQKIKNKLMQSWLFSLGISLTVLPLLLWHFFAWNPFSIILTLLLGVIFEHFLYSLFVMLFLLPITFLVNLTNQIVFWLNSLLTLVDHLLPINWCLGRPNLALMLIFWLFIFIIIHLLENEKKLTAVFLSLALIPCLWLVNHPTNGLVMMVDVGQGDSFLIAEPFNKKVSLIDTGGKINFGKQQQKSNAESTLIPVLQSRGIRVIDELFLTHADVDHCGDIEELAKTVKIKKIYLAKGAQNRPNLRKKLQNIIAKYGTSVKLVLAPQKIAEFYLLAPQKAGNGENNDSLVLFRTIKGVKFLFTGDLEKQGELELIKNYPMLNADVLKVSHHGSKTATSSELLQVLNPKLALISVGKNNRFSHPHPDTLSRLAGRNIYRTDQVGAIYFNWSIFNNKLSNLQTVIVNE